MEAKFNRRPILSDASIKRVSNHKQSNQDSTIICYYYTKALAGCNAWVQECQRMTSLFWKNDMYHPWRGEPFQSQNLLKLRDRINQVCRSDKLLRHVEFVCLIERLLFSRRKDIFYTASHPARCSANSIVQA